MQRSQKLNLKKLESPSQKRQRNSRKLKLKNNLKKLRSLKSKLRISQRLQTKQRNLTNLKNSQKISQKSNLSLEIRQKKQPNLLLSLQNLMER